MSIKTKVLEKVGNWKLSPENSKRKSITIAEIKDVYKMHNEIVRETIDLTIKELKQTQKRDKK